MREGAQVTKTAGHRLGDEDDKLLGASSDTHCPAHMPLETAFISSHICERHICERHRNTNLPYLSFETEAPTKNSHVQGAIYNTRRSQA